MCLASLICDLGSKQRARVTHRPNGAILWLELVASTSPEKYCLAMNSNSGERGDHGGYWVDGTFTSGTVYSNGNDVYLFPRASQEIRTQLNADR